MLLRLNTIAETAWAMMLAKAARRNARRQPERRSAHMRSVIRVRRALRRQAA